MNIHEENVFLKKALDTIAGGYIDRFPSAPNIDMEPVIFQSKMWSWSQRVAKDALDKTR